MAALCRSATIILDRKTGIMTAVGNELVIALPRVFNMVAGDKHVGQSSLIKIDGCGVSWIGVVGGDEGIIDDLDVGAGIGIVPLQRNEPRSEPIIGNRDIFQRRGIAVPTDVGVGSGRVALNQRVFTDPASDSMIRAVVGAV